MDLVLAEHGIDAERKQAHNAEKVQDWIDDVRCAILFFKKANGSAKQGMEQGCFVFLKYKKKRSMYLSALPTGGSCEPLFIKVKQ